jgi:hypothetical protein
VSIDLADLRSGPGDLALGGNRHIGLPILRGHLLGRTSGRPQAVGVNVVVERLEERLPTLIVKGGRCGFRYCA